MLPKTQMAFPGLRPALHKVTRQPKKGCRSRAACRSRAPPSTRLFVPLFESGPLLIIISKAGLPRTILPDRCVRGSRLGSQARRKKKKSEKKLHPHRPSPLDDSTNFFFFCLPAPCEEGRASHGPHRVARKLKLSGSLLHKRLNGAVIGPAN